MAFIVPTLRMDALWRSQNPAFVTAKSYQDLDPYPHGPHGFGSLDPDPQNWFKQIQSAISYLCTYDLYGPVRNAFDAGSIHHEGKWEGGILGRF
jgi:hypothetical protein